MSIDDTLELDAIIKKWDNPDGVITDSDNQFNMSGFYTGTGVLDPQNAGKHTIKVNGQELTVEVLDPSNILQSAVAQFDAQSSFEDSGGTSTATFPDLVSGNDISGDSVTIESNGINSHLGLHYNRQQQGSSNIVVSTPFTTITVFKNNETGDTGGDEDTAYGDGSAPVEYNLDKSGTWAATATGGSNAHINSNLEPVGPRIVTVVWDHTSQVRHRILSFNSTGSTVEFEGTGDIIDDISTSGWALGGSYNEDSGDSDITVGEHIIYNTSLSKDEYQSEESRLAQKWG